MLHFKHINQNGIISDAELDRIVHEACEHLPADGKRVLFVVPDTTRSMPMPQMFRSLNNALRNRAKKIDYLIALGTHPPMPEEVICRHFGITPEERVRTYGHIGIFNHAWDNPDALTTIGTLTALEIETLSDGHMSEGVDVRINKRILDYDVLCVVGPVFPHEVVGFSGGNKYFFPGVSGPEILNLFHWLGALITNYAINGTKDTPVRRVVDRAAAMIPNTKCCFCLTVVGHETHALFFGSPEGAWNAAADLSKEKHIQYKDRPFKSVLAMAPPMYDDIWVAGKCMYKLEPVVADGGELIIYAPHIKDISFTHDKHIRSIGYHVRDYFVAQMEKFRDVPRGILAHSTHVRGMGSFLDGQETPRVRVTLATQIPEADCDAINLGYRNPSTINPDDWRDKEDEGLLLVQNAGEILYHLKSHDQT